MKEELILEVGKTYQTSCQLKEKFEVTKLTKNTVWGIYVNRPHLGICPLNYNQLRELE